MLTKAMIAVVMSGALLVAGDAAYKQFGCCGHRCEVGTAPPSCCQVPVVPRSSDCCAPQSDCCQPVRDCCVLAKTSATAAVPCCNATLSYCTRTDTIYEGCCCEVVNGRFLCLITGEISDECCCIPIE